MKRPLLIFLSFALTFFLGGVTAWLLKPAPPIVAAASATSLGERLLQQLDVSLQFTDAQKNALRPLCEEWGNKAAAVGRRPNQRKELFMQYAPRIRQLLATNQLARYDEFVAEAKTRSPQRKLR
ncbi:MAG: hypothetical protein ABI042_17650 [Verrucomicrobiota bacterium]